MPIEFPHGRLSAQSLPALNQVLEITVKGGTPEEVRSASAWIEKLIRLVELNRFELKKVFRNRFQKDTEYAVQLAYQILVLSAHPPGTQRLRPFPDLRSLNAALYLDDSKQIRPYLRKSSKFSELRANLKNLISELPEHLAARKLDDDPWVIDRANAPKFAAQRPAEKPLSGQSFLVFSANPYSLNTVATLWMLHEYGAKISSLVVRRLASLRRIREELAFSPRRLVSRVVNEIVLSGNKKKASSDAASLAPFLESLRCTETNAVTLASKLGANVAYFGNFNDPDAIAYFHSQPANCAIFTGGGLLGEPVVEAFDCGIVHAHPGILPQYRGMDVVQWAILEGSFDQIGSTCQIMTTGIDVGPLLGNLTVDPKEFNRLQGIRTAVVERKIGLVTEMAIAYATGQRTTIPHPSGGYQYFLMHPKLESLTADYFAGHVQKL